MGWLGVSVRAFVACGVLAMSVALPSGALGADWSAGVEAGLPANAGSDPSVGYTSVSCASAGDCTGVGGYRDNAGRIQGLLSTETAGGWAAGVEAGLPSDASASVPAVSMDSVSCASPGDCGAVGDYTDSSGNQQGLLLTQTGGAWAAGAEATLPADAGSSPAVNVSSVSCASAGDCTAVGQYADSSGHFQGLLLSETGGVWAAGVRAALPADAGPDPSVDLDSVSCASAGDCAAAGSYFDSSGHLQSLVLTESGGAWAPGVQAVLPADASANTVANVSSVSCASAGDCTAVGDYVDSSNSLQGLLLTETGGVWGAGVRAILPADASRDQSVALVSVSCASAGDCTAVGQYGTGEQQGLLLTETGGTWAAGIKAEPPGADADKLVGLSSVSCAAVGDCAAVGNYVDSSGDTRGLLLSEVAGKWAAGNEAGLPAGAGSNPEAFVNSVSCGSVGDCAAAGSYRDGANTGEGLLLSGEPTVPQIYIAEFASGHVDAANLDGSGFSFGDFITGPSGPVGVAVDGQHVYWANPFSDTIGRANLDGSGVDQNFVTGPKNLNWVAVDGQHVYWTSDDDTTIGRANLDGTDVNQDFITGVEAEDGVAVDGQHIYWASDFDGTIGRANLDGSGIDPSFITGAEEPKGVAVDGQHVYWANSSDGSIGRANLDGTGVQQDFIASASGAGDVAVDGQHIYWANGFGGTIGRANLDGTGVDPSFITGAHGAEGLAVSVPVAQVTPAEPPAFAATAVGTVSAPQTLTITNVGQRDLSVSGVSLTGQDPGDFTVESNTCAGHRSHGIFFLAKPMAPGQNCQVTVQFSPGGAGSRTAALQLTSNDVANSPLQVPLQGAGLAPPVAPELK